MVGPDDVISWKDLGTGGAVVISGIVAWSVKLFTKRLDDHEAEDRKTFKEIFEGQKEISRQIAAGFLDVERSMNETHVKLLERISDVQQDLTGKNHS